MRVVRYVLLAGLIGLVSPIPIAALQDPPPPTRPNQRQADVQGQRGRQGQGPPAARPGMPIQQLQSLFDAHVLVQARRALQLSDEQYQSFFMRMSRMQEIRRRNGQQRMRLLNELRRKWSPQADEGELTALARQLDELESTSGNELRAARKAIDEALTPRQAAFFRFFEEDMERQKIDFITRSRR